MIDDPQELMSGYFDNTLTNEQELLLNEWIKSEPANARRFAEAALLHDRLRDTLLASLRTTPDAIVVPDLAVDPQLTADERLTLAPPISKGWLVTSLPTVSLWSTGATIAVAILIISSLWLGFGTSTASAAYRELDRIIESSIQSRDRTYEVIVESISTPTKRGKRFPIEERSRPEKPPLNGALLYVRENNRFVLIRKTAEGTPFITGSNGQQSWAVNNKGPVRVSDDVNHFARDLPGHETSIPLTNLHEGLERLRAAYKIELSPVGPEEFETEDGESVRMLIAVKKPKERGPQRVEIAYGSQSGRILHMRFIQMPYGPDRLDLRLNLIAETELPNSFFEHSSHHQLDRSIEMEK